MKNQVETLVKSVIGSTEKYILFLKENSRGVSRYDAHDIHQQIDNKEAFFENSVWQKYKCSLQPHLGIRPDPATFIPIDNPTTEIEIRILEYDRRTGLMSFAVKKQLTCTTGKIVIDFRWIIKRCLDWYNNRSALICDIKEIKRYTEKGKYVQIPSMSDEQNEAVRTILSKPLSYIWGPPGTGKMG